MLFGFQLEEGASRYRSHDATTSSSSTLGSPSSQPKVNSSPKWHCHQASSAQTEGVPPRGCLHSPPPCPTRCRPQEGPTGPLDEPPSHGQSCSRAQASPPHELLQVPPRDAHLPAHAKRRKHLLPHQLGRTLVADLEVRSRLGQGQDVLRLMLR